MSNYVGEKLYKARKDKGYTRDYIAKLVDVAESTIKRYEDGHIKAIPFSKLEKLTNILGLDTNEILGWGIKGIKEKTANPFDGLNEEEIQKAKDYIKLLKRR